MTNSHTSPVSPHLVCANAIKAIAFYKDAFGAIEVMKLTTQHGILIHATLLINGSTIMLTEENPRWGSLSPLALKGSPVTIHLLVPDVDGFVEIAVKAGATIKMPVTNMFWGDRYGIVTDPFGHNWSIATHQRDMTIEEIQSAMELFMSANDEKH